jgi:predicted dehydrogenase
MVKAARKYNRLVQVGTQRRSSSRIRRGIEYLQSGELGKIQYVVCFANKTRTPIGNRTEPLPIPGTLDYELWCGPALKEPLYRDRIQYDCSFTWNMGDGESCNQGVHEIDVARWLLGEEKLPRRVMSIGGRFCFNDAGNVPNTQITYYDFPSAPVLYEVHNMTAGNGSKQRPTFRGVSTDTCVQCEGGYVMLNAGHVYDKSGKKIKTFDGSENIFSNFIGAVRSGRQEDLCADVLKGHRSTAVTHTGNISYRLGKKATVDEIRAQVRDTPVLEEMFDRFLVHLKAHEVDVDANTITLGPCLQIDRENQRFQDNAEANRLVKGSYRDPWTIPAI